MAATLAHAAVAFADMPELSAHYWDKAKMAYAQTGVDNMQFGNSNEAFTDLAIYYASGGVVSHVLFGAASMYTACKALKCGDEKVYLDHVMELGNMKEPDGGQKWFWEVPGWDNAWCAFSCEVHPACLHCIGFCAGLCMLVLLALVGMKCVAGV